MPREYLGFGLVVAVLVTALSLPFLVGRTAPSLPGKTTIRFLTYETGHEQMVLVNEIVRRFEQTHPNIHVETEFNARANEKVYVEMASGTAPDVLYAVRDDIPKMALRGGIVDILPLMKRDKVDLSPYFPQIIDAMRFKGGMYAFPFHFSTDILFYNQDLFDQAGVPYPDDSWDYNTWIEASKKLTKTDAKGNITVFGTMPPDAVPWALAYGAKQFNDDYTQCLLNSPEGREAFQFRKDLVYKYHVSPTADQQSGIGAIMMFNTGRVAMMPGRTYMVIDMNKQITSFRYNAGPIPKGKKSRVVRLAVGGICMSTQCQHREEAWQFMKFYASEKGGLDILGHQKNCVPGAIRLAYSKDYFQTAPPENTRIFVDSIKDAVITVPPILQCNEYKTRILNPGVTDIQMDLKSVDQGLKEIQTQTDVLLKER